MMKATIILAYSIGAIICFDIVPDRNDNNEENLAQLAANIFLQHCKIKCETSLVIYANDFLADLFFEKISHQNLDKGVYSVSYSNLTANNTAAWKTGYKLDLTVILLNDYNTIEDLIFNIEILPFWNLRGRFLVVAPGVDPDDDEWIEESFKSFWERQALRVVICFWRNGPKIFSYNPFLENYGMDVTDRSDLAQILAHKITNMNGYPIKLYYFDYVYKNSKMMKISHNGKEEWIGMDGKFWDTLAHGINASVEVHMLSEDITDDMAKNADHDIPVREFVNVFASLYDFDILCTAGRIYQDNDLDHVFLYERNDMHLVFPRGKLIPTYLYIFLIIPLDIWGLTLGSLAIISLLEIFIQKKVSNHNQSDIIIVFMNNYRLLLNESVPTAEQDFYEKFVMIVWITFCIVFCTLFQSLLMTTLVSPQYYPDIDSLEDLFETDMSIYVTHFTAIHFKRTLQQDNIKILKHLKVIPKEVTVYGETMEWLDLYRFNSGIMVPNEHINFLKANNKNDKRPDFHVMKEILMPNALAFNIRNEKLFYEEILDGMGRIRQAGLIEFWTKYNFGIDVKILAGNVSRNENNIVEESDGEVSLTLEHLKVAFIALILGAVFAFVTFCFELVLNKCKT